ncbi:type IV toxin-antitoxin system AbiEi family antitoxin domain-containing protein [Micromonospora marina]|uniref:type IV toxin-antitoxin system AbiEi family antitoxin domain-containing protein n=1 Tax=Micromonospora marina TaxID=307120 RepID=UPI003D764267
MGEFGELTRLAATQGGFVTAGQALRLGVGREQIRYLVRSGRWTRVSRGCYLPSPAGPAPVSFRRAMIRAAIASIGPGAVAVLDTAAELHGIAGLPPTAAIHVPVPPHRPHVQRRAEPSLTVHQLTLGDADVCRADGVPVTTPARTVADVLLRARRYPAVCVLDSALDQGILAEADGRAQSPLETRARLRCVDGGVPPEVLQLPVRDDDGYLLGIGDLAWRGARLIAEADGRAPHLTPEAVYADRFRQNRLVNAGWRILRFTWSDTMRPDYIPQTVKHALRQSPKQR